MICSRRLAGLFTALALGSPLLPLDPARAQQHDHAGHDHATPPTSAPATQPGDRAADAADLGDPYPLNVDPVTGEALGAQTVDITHDGRALRFASPENAATFREDPEQYLDEVDGRIIDGQLPFYPLETCPVGGEKLGSMGEPVDVVYRNRLVRFCCPGCVGQFENDPAATLAKLDEAVVARQGETYPLTTCPVSGAKLGSMGEPVDLVVANRLVRLCCEGCEGQVMANPAKVLDAVDGAWEKSDATPGVSAAGSAVGEPAQTQPSREE